MEMSLLERNIQLIPYGLLRSFRDIDQRDPNHPFFESRTLKPDIGLDGKFILHGVSCSMQPSIPTSARSNPTSHRSPSTSALKFSFPRSVPSSWRTATSSLRPINLVFTRRIAHPEFGLRLTGKSGPWAVGVLASDDRAPGEILPLSDPHSGDRATFAIARVSRDILDQSTIGATFTDREFGGGYNRVGGVDANVKIGQNWRFRARAVTSSTLNVVRARILPDQATRSIWNAPDENSTCKAYMSITVRDS